MTISKHITIIKAGIQTTVQDAGRSGLRHLGICQSGALDLPSFLLANCLVGNHGQTSDAALEVVIGPVHIRFEADTFFALSGADFNASLDGIAIAPAWRVLAKAGQILQLTGAKTEMRAYIAFEGGLDVPLVLGARATDLQAHFGGWQGRSVQVGDQLPLAHSQVKNHNETHLSENTHQKINLKQSHSFGVLQRTWTPEVRVLIGAEFSQFTTRSQKNFFSQAWCMSAQSNRMGARLQGQALELERNHTIDLLSHAVTPGTIQVPPNGLPIVLLADSQTTGGYPRIAHVIQADLWKLAQTRTGQSFCFSQTDRETALAAQRKWLYAVENISREINRRITK